VRRGQLDVRAFELAGAQLGGQHGAAMHLFEIAPFRNRHKAICSAPPRVPADDRFNRLVHRYTTLLSF
jgi:hypothetical protein